MLTSKQRAYLRSLAAREDTILQIGKDGITENTAAAMSDALRARELVKGRVLETLRPKDFMDLTVDMLQAALEREKRMQKALLMIKKKFGKNAILKGMNLEEGATAKDRNSQIGGHKA